QLFPSGEDARRGEDPRRDPVSADLAHAGGAQVGGVLADVAQVHDADLAAVLEDADELVDRTPALIAPTDVVDDEVGDDGVEGRIGEWELADIAVADLDAIGDPLRGRIREGHGRTYY